MKIAVFGLDIPPGKYKYQSECFDKLVKKITSQKTSPYGIEFLENEVEKSDAVVFEKTRKVDLALIDLEKIENRLLRAEDEQEKNLLRRFQESLERETLLCEVEFSQEESAAMRLLGLVTAHPCVGVDAGTPVQDEGRETCLRDHVHQEDLVPLLLFPHRLPLRLLRFLRLHVPQGLQLCTSLLVQVGAFERRRNEELRGPAPGVDDASVAFHQPLEDVGSGHRQILRPLRIG